MKYCKKRLSRRKAVLSSWASTAALVAIMPLMGCGSSVPSSDGGSTGSPITDEPTVNATADGDGNVALSESKVREAVDASVVSIANAIAAVVPATDLQEILEGGMPLPSCPKLELQRQANQSNLSLNYEGSCSPTRFQNARFSGQVIGTVLTEANAFDYSVRRLEINGDQLNGSISGSFVSDGKLRRLNLSVTLTDGQFISNGRLRADVEGDGGILIHEANVTIRPQGGGAIEAQLQDVAIDGAAGGVFEPSSGKATARSGGSESTAYAINWAD